MLKLNLLIKNVKPTSNNISVEFQQENTVENINTCIIWIGVCDSYVTSCFEQVGLAFCFLFIDLKITSFNI